MQETWAIHGVYPTIAWTPDSASIVFWAAGKIQRIAARGPSAGLVTEIAFSVDDTRTIYDHVLTPQTAWEEMLMSRPDATKEPTSTEAVGPKKTPLGLTRNTLPLALSEP